MKTSVSIVAVVVGFLISFGKPIPDARPLVSERKFKSDAVENLILSWVPLFKDEELAIIFKNCFPNTLDTTIDIFGPDDTFVITGDIDAMWLRDSTNQLAPYLQLPEEFSADEDLRGLLRGAVLRQLKSILIDSYANAFNQEANGLGHQTDIRKPEMKPSVFEGKYELDSLAAVLKLSHRYWLATGDIEVFESDSTYLDAVEEIFNTIVEQQKGTVEDGLDPTYYFVRNSLTDPDQISPEIYPDPTTPVKRCGLSKTGFRPSDDKTRLPFLIPANAMAAVELNNTADLLSKLKGEQATRAAGWAIKFRMLSAQLKNGIEKMAKMGDPEMYAYEVDGFGRQVLYDDANIPSLLSLPYLNYTESDDITYNNTRNYLLSNKNQYFYEGKEGRGIGSYHTKYGYIWPMSVTLQAITSNDDDEIMDCLNTLKNSARDTGLMHESFDANNSAEFSRKWFAWANSLFGELILKLAKEKPHLIFEGEW